MDRFGDAALLHTEYGLYGFKYCICKIIATILAKFLLRIIMSHGDLLLATLTARPINRTYARRLFYSK
jgi:DTW domain-containing protein YfiP